MDVLPPELWGEIDKYTRDGHLRWLGLAELGITVRSRVITKGYHFEGGEGRCPVSPKCTLVRSVAEVRGPLEKLARLGCPVALQLVECSQEHVDALAGAYACVCAITIKWSALTSVEAIKGIPDVCLLNCHALIDIGTLGTQKCVRIDRCPVKDISSLADVKTLEINSCAEITSISCLGRQDRLCVAYCPHVIDFAAVARVPRLSIRGGNLTELFDAENETLTLSGCRQLTDISRLKDVRCLSVNNCPNIAVGIHVLANVTKELRIAGAPNTSVRPLSPVLRARAVYIRYCTLSNTACLRNVENVTLVHCPNIVDVAPLHGARKVCLESCAGIKDITPLRNVENVTLVHCPNIVDVATLRGARKVYLESCAGIKDIAPLRDVPILHLFSINADCSCLGSQYRLELGNMNWRKGVYNCPVDCNKLLNCYRV